MINTRSIVRLLCFVPTVSMAALLLTACEKPAVEPKYESIDYNVILISIDTLRADHLGAYGYPRNTSPNIDSFAEDSVVFKSAIAQAPSTLPSHASIFTGMIPVHHGAFAAWQSPIDEDLPTLPEIMRDSGFRAAGFNGGGLVAPVYGFSRGFEEYVADSKHDRFQDKVDAARNWIDGLDGEKFFLFLHTYEVHDPYSPDPALLAQFEEGYSGELSNDIGSRELAAINRYDAVVSPEDLQHVINAYDAEILSMDIAFGNLIRYLKEKGVYDDTLIILTSDHGEEFGEHGRIGRHFFTLYDELIHVPLIMKMPGSSVAGVAVDDQVRGIDILPTVLDVLAINYEPGIDGTSLVPLALGDAVDPLVAISQQDTSDALPPTSIRTAAQKLIVRPNYYVEFGSSYPWVKDRFEFLSDATTVTLLLASASTEGEIKISIDGDNGAKARIGSEPRSIDVILRVGGQPGSEEGSSIDGLRQSSDRSRRVVVESLSPCVDAEVAGIDTELECVSFASYDPQEYYLLNPDPGEHHNRYESAEYRDEIDSLRNRLQTEINMNPATEIEAVEIDDETRKQLKSLGYLN